MAFPTTRWTLLAEATLHGDAAGREALARMCQGYRRPVEMFLASRGHANHEIEDLTQDFFLRWLKSRAWKRADRVRGKFRTFMLGTLNHVLAHEAPVKRFEPRWQPTFFNETRGRVYEWDIARFRQELTLIGIDP